MDDTADRMMSKSDLDRWRSAGTMPQLGHVMAAWLAGDIASRPGCRPGASAPPGIAGNRDAREALIAVNQVGLVTINAQIADSGRTTSGDWWVKAAAVQGFVNRPLLETLIPELDQAGIRHRVWEVRPAWKLFGGHGLPVCWVNNKPIVGDYGRQMSAKDIQSAFDVCQPGMLSVLKRSQQITISHPVAGLNELWPVLTRWAFYQR